MSVWPWQAICVLSASCCLTLILLTTVLLFGAPIVVLAQAGQTELTGEVRDSSGAAVEQATITITQVETGDVTTATTGTEGIYTVTNLRPGLYNLTVGAHPCGCHADGRQCR
jgi:Carboxypeptidase regulatory-like domain